MSAIQKLGWVLFTVVLITGGGFFSASLHAQPEEIEFCKDKERGPVMFPHESHMGDHECLDCHHDIQNGENVLDEGNLEEGNPSAKCSTCHNTESKIETREAFHRQCMGCHDNSKKGPNLCGECHTLEK
ncbi:MAG: cytochrome c family protein [Proteobacteria bacterium]|nr:cytochrome c family protein [Pseudomonadota bacterium]